ncbi:uncharacterized protein [Ptychodera flava]
MSLNLRNVRIEEVSPSNEMLNSDRVEFFRRTLEEKPLAFSFQDGEIPEICPDMEEPSWALNIKRGILSHFQSSYFRKQEKSAIETDVTGSCPTKFIVERGYYGSQTIRKSKDFMGCSDRHHIESAIQSSIYDPLAPTQSLVSSSQNCDQVIEDDRVKSVACKESHISRPFANHENGALTKIRTTLEFYDIARRTSSAYKLESQVQTRKTLLFDHKPKTETESEDESRVEEVLDEICRTVRDDVRPETAEQFTKLVFRMRKLKSNSLHNIHRHIQEGRICNYQKDKIEKFFMDAIPMMSTTAAVTFMTEKISSEEIKGVDADMWLLSLSFITHPTKEMIKEVRELVQYSNPRRSTYLAISSMIHRYCESEERDCLKDDEITSTLRLFEENLGWKCSARNTDDEEKILLSLKALGNSGQISSATSVLTRCFQEEDNSIEIRLAAIEAFRRMPCEVEGREEQMKMLEDIKGNTEVRIAAYLAVMKCPTPKVLKRIHAVLEKEEINQVGSFMWSHLKGLNSTSDPLKQDIRKMLEDTKLIRNYNKDPRKFSRAFEGSLFSEDMNLGGTVENHLIFSPESWIPRSGMMNLTAQVFGYSINLFEFGGRIEGFDYLLEKFFGPKGYFPDNNLLEMVKAPEMDARQKRSAIKPSKLENLHNRFDAKQPNSPKGSMYMKMFGNELSSVDFQKIDWLKPEKESVNLLEMLIKLSKEQTKEFTKNMILMESSFDTPTIIGLPLNLAVNSTASMNLKVSGKADLRKVMVSPRSLNITGAIRPSAVIEVSSEMSLSAFVAHSGLRMVTRMHSSTALDGSISLDSSETFKVKFNVPDNRLDIIDVSNKLYLVNAEFPMEIAGITENYRQHSKCTGHIVEKWAGVRLCGELRYPNASQKLDTPYFPLTGPVSMKVTLDKVDPTLSSYEMEAKYQVQRKRVNAKTEISDVLRFMIGTPGTHMPRTHSVDVVLNRAQKALSVDLVSLDKKVFIQTKMVNESDIKRLELNVNYNNMMQYTTSAEVVIDRDENSKLVKYMPTIEVRLPNRIGMTLSGTFSHEPERKLEADVTYDGIGGKSRFIGKVLNETDMKSLALSVSYNDGTPYTLEAEVGLDRGYQQIRFRPSVAVSFNKRNMRMFGAITHQTERSLDVDMTLRGVREEDMSLTANIVGEKWRSLNTAVTLKGIKTEDITFSSAIRNDMWKSFNVDMSLTGLTARPISFSSDIEGEKWSRLKVESRLGGVRENEIVFTSTITGEKWRRLNTAITLKGIKTEDITFSSAIRNDMWKSLNVDMSLTGLTTRPISFSSDIEGEKWSRLKVESRLGGVKEDEIVFTSTITGEKWRHLNVDMALKGVREDDLVLICDVTANKWYSLDGSIALKGVRERDITFAANMENQPWTRHDSTFTLKGVRDQDIVLQTSVSGEKGRNLDGMMTLRGVKSNDITLSTRLRGDYMSFFEGSVTLAGIRKEEMSLSTTLRGEMGKEFYGTVNLKGIRRNPMTLTTSLSGEPWKKFEGDIEFTEVNKKGMRLRTVINGEKWTHLDGSIILTGAKENEISLTTNIDNDPWRSLNGQITLRGVKESDISLTAAMNGDYMRSFNGRFQLRGIRERDINLDTSISTDKESRLNAEMTLRGIKERKISLSTDITGAKWRSLNANLALKGVTERDLSLDTNVEAEKWSRLDTDLTISGIREHDIIFSSKIHGEKWRSLNANLALKGVTERDLSLDTTVEAEKWRRLDTDLTISGIREHDIVFSSKINGEKWRSLNANLALKGVTERDLSLDTKVEAEKWSRLDADLTISGIRERDIVFSSKINGEKWSSLNANLALKGVTERDLSVNAKVEAEKWRRLDTDLTISGIRERDIVFSSKINGEKWSSLNANLALKGVTERALSLDTKVEAEKWRRLDTDLTISGIRERDIVFSSKINGEKWRSLNVDMSLSGAHESTFSLQHDLAMEWMRSLEASLRMDGLGKMLEINHKLVNNEALKRFELDINANNEKRYTTNAEVAIDERNGMVQYLPTFEVHLPENKNLILRGSVGYQPKRAIDIYFTLSRSGAVEMTLEGNFLNENNEKFNTAVTFTHSKINLAIRDIFQHTREILGSDLEIEYTLAGKATQTMRFSDTIRNKTTEVKHSYEYDSSMFLSQWPQYNFEGQLAVSGAARREGSVDLTVCYGERTCQDDDKKITFSISMKNESNVYVNKASAAMALAHKGSDLDVSMDMSHENTDHFLQTQASMNYKPGRRCGMLVELRNNTHDLKKLTGEIRINCLSSEISLTQDFEEVRPKNYKSDTVLQLDSNTKYSIEAEYNNNTDEFKFDHDGKVLLKSQEHSIVLQGNGFRDEKKMNGEVEFKYAPSRIISFSAEYKNKSNKRRNSREATVRFDTPFRLFRDMQLTASLDNTDVLYESEVTLQYAPSKTVSMQGRYQNAGDEALSRHEVEVSFNIPRREIHIFTYVQNSSREYELGSQFKLIPEFGDKKELTFALGYGNYTDNTKLHHEVSMEVSTNSRNILAEFGVEKSERGFVTETLLRWSPEKQMIFTVNLDNKSSRRQTEFDVSVNFNHPSRQVILELHHENTTGHINSKVDLSWEPTSKMTTELNYDKRRAEDKDEHTTRFTITHPQKTMILSFNLAKNERMFSNEFEMVLDGKSQLKLGSEYHNETDSRKLKHDIIVDFESDMVSEDPVHFEFHVDKIEWEMSMESKLTYQRDQEIELEMSHTVPHKTESSQRNEVNFKLDTPLENSHPLTTIEVEGSWEHNYDNNDATHHAEVELQWGRKRRSQRVSMQAEYERKIDGDRKEHSVEMKVKHPVELPLIPREPEMKVKLVSTPNSKESKVTYQWSDDVDPAVIETVYRNYTTSSKLHHLLDVIVKHPNLEEDIHLTTETKLFNGPTLLNTMVSLIYSTDKQKTLFFRAKAMNKSDESELRYAFETELRHLYNNIDFVLESQMGNTKQKADGRFEMTYKGEEKYNSVKFNGEVNKKDKSFYVKADMPIKTIEMTGKFENRSTAEHTIYYMTLDNKYDGWKEVHSSIDINTQERLFEVTVHHNSERPEDYMRLTAQFLNRTAVEVRAHRNILGEMITDALIYARLNTSEILHTRIHWRPQMPREVKEFTLKAIEKMNQTLRVELVHALKEKYWEMKYSIQDEIRSLNQESDALREWEKDLNKLGEELKKKAMEVYDDMKPEYKENLEKMKQKIQDKYEEIRTDITKKYKEFQEQQLKEMKETLKQKWDEVKEQAIEYYDEEIRPVWNEIKDAFEVVADLARKDFEDIKEFWMEKCDELKAILEEHTETLRQKLEDLKAKFDELYEDMKEKMGELKADAALKIKEYRQKWEVTKARMVNATTQAMKAMEAKWNETRELAMKQWEEYKATAEKMYEEYKAIVMEKWEEYKTKSLEKYEEYKAIVMKKYEEYRAVAMKKWEEARDKALKMWEDAKTKALAKWEEYKEEYKPQIEDLKRRYENVREVIKKRYEEAKEKLEEYLDDIKSKFEDQYREILSMREVQEIMEMKALKDVPQIVVEEAKWAWNYWQVENSTKELYHRSINTTMRLIGELKEELKSKYILFQPENGNIFITIPLPLKQHSFDTLPDIRGTYLEMFYNVDVMDMYYRYKPSMDVWDWIPPHKSHAMVAGLQHYMTFDKKFYEFAGACSYIVARDFIDGNFSVVVNYDRDSDEPIKNSLTVISQDREIEIQPDFEVKMDDTTVELPIQHRNTTITREGSTIRVHNTNGVTVICNLPRDVCTVEVSGWYFHKTAGLAGTYNNEPSDDFLTSDGSVADNAENLARSWEVGKQCSDHRNRIRNCDNISESPRAEMCNKLFMNDASPLRKCFGVVDPLAFREMCLNDLCNGNEVETEELPCNSAAAYVSECKMRGVPMYMPKTCVSCEKPNGGIFHKHENIKLTSTKDNVPKSADVVVIVEEKKCNEEVTKELSDFVRQLDSEFKSQGLQGNRYGLIGFGGEGVHSDVHSHTIDSKLFNKARKFLLGSDSLVFSEAETAKNNDTFNAIRAATEYPFRTGVAKSIILLACNDCGKSRFHYDEIINLLRDQGISLHVMTDNGFKIKKSSVVIYGVDAKTVFTSKDVDNPFGTKDLREFVRGPDNQCTRLAMASNGTVFDAGRMHEKAFSGIFCPRMVFTTKPSPCQICECVENVYGMGSSICRPCEETTPIRPVKLQPSISSSSLEVKSSKEVIKAELKNKKFDAWLKKQKQ